jgi:hemolysin III
MRFKLKDPGSAITHLIGAILSLIVAGPMIIQSILTGDYLKTVSLTIFVVSMFLLYSASTLYHSIDSTEKVNRRLKKLDHCMIFILIAGSYTPICTLALKGFVGYGLLTLVWFIALLGICFKLFWVYCPKWISSIMYIAMGWTCILAISPIIHSLSRFAFIWLVLGGIIYTIGGIIYALKLPIFNGRHKNFGSHEIFHLFVMAGSACHFVVMYSFV